MLKGIANAFRIPELRKKILITIGILALYRFGAYLPAPGVPFASMLEAFQTAAAGSGAIAVLNLFSGGALSRVSVFSLGIMPYITAQIILQMFQAVRHWIQIGHGTDSRIAAMGRRQRTGMDCFFIRKTRLSEMNMHITETGQNC